MNLALQGRKEATIGTWATQWLTKRYNPLCVPTADIDLDPSLPANAEFWVPEPDEIDDCEGFGLFQDVWPITDVSADNAIAVVPEDELLCRVVADLAHDAADFDILAAAVETGSIGDDDEITADSLSALASYLTGSQR